MHDNAKNLFVKFASQYFNQDLKVLEIGPNAAPSDFQKLMEGKYKIWDTLDLERGAFPLTYRTKDEYRFPIDDRQYDIVLSSSVIEHVRKIWLWMPELARVTVPGGTIITISPISWEYHEDPVDCWRIYPEGMKALCEHANLSVEVCEWDALGIAWLRRLGGSIPLWQKLGGVLNILYFKFRIPVEAAFELITIAKTSRR